MANLYTLLCLYPRPDSRSQSAHRPKKRIAIINAFTTRFLAFATPENPSGDLIAEPKEPHAIVTSPQPHLFAGALTT